MVKPSQRRAGVTITDIVTHSVGSNINMTGEQLELVIPHSENEKIIQGNFAIVPLPFFL